jgi:hypothetical protein
VILIDDILLSPVRGILWIFREIHESAMEEARNESESITQQLRSLYMQLETGKLSDLEFDAQEKQLLDRLDEIQGEEQPVGHPM